MRMNTIAVELLDVLYTSTCIYTLYGLRLLVRSVVTISMKFERACDDRDRDLEIGYS